jgi:flagellar protein FlaI
MMDLGTASAEIMAYLWICQQYQQSILIAGGTATGKTSFLNATVSFIPPEDKIVSIEDTRELQLPHENWIPSVTREMFGSGEDGNVDMDELLKESFRQNPDYVVVGEVRGEEASVLFQGMSSGHPSMGTIHASSPNAVVKRLVTPPISLSPALIEAIDVMVLMTHAKGVDKSARRVKSIHELQKVVGESASARTNEAFVWTAMDDSYNQRGEPYLFDQISNDYGISKDKLKEELEQRTHILEWLQDKGVKDFDTVSEIIAEYYKNKEEILKMVNAENDDYTLEDVVQAESKVDLSHRDQLDNAMDQDEENSKENEESEELESKVSNPKLDSDASLGQKKTVDKNPVADLEKRLKDEEDKIDSIRSRDPEDKNKNPFGNANNETDENPFEA